MTTTSERRTLAKTAEAALSAYLAQCGDMLWPEERSGLQKSRKFLARESED